ncbi:SDR family oxidoreductase [Sulfolobus acidocaldarius]|uniref:Short chain dehydrogenase n=4 Tax=Sulfolobus acidocaldarius TaxID=2285 RepID=Q4JC24_SULAC|nr:SDR family oxidoreductase [Sulfolobus acidocaldarius]AAY79655.1 short chain dehydrogenase [Sulfolobus acidocaldarius DSM 639]AGE70212.1 3-ketoacyl-(acyl-carrier-protein) reductase [Sulfolobus acidocaldarius N8]AGE72487.1 3-ketoacyl-(acyl-carrier-protein) reductase [Sulfolobus acidocaldarius Ron12/I]ALU29379.1 3-ketoacyl-ACP reductase [Sulfolobus acidocaldarius]ALU32108.1 3-ketoacyl-ACP reductase [Sulfolobus acidocaldarius]
MFKGKNVVITGGTRGIGRAIAERFNSLGAKVFVLYASSESQAKELESKGIVTIKCNVSKRDQVIEASKKVREITNNVDVIVNNAGVMYTMPFEEFDEEKYRRMMDINLNGTIYVIHTFLPFMKERGGVIVNIASNAGIGTSAVGTTFYAITKSAVIMLTRRLAFELGKYNIRVNAVAPGWVETDLTVSGKSPEETEKIKQWFRDRTVLHTTGRPEDIAGIVTFLSSDDAKYITGQVIVADGGRIDYLTHSL